MMTIEEFCDLHDACDEGREWALAECQTMQEVWDKAKPEWLIWVATRKDVLNDRTLRLFACWCVRQVWHLLDDDRSKNAVIVAEQYAAGIATDDELAAARSAARAAARSAASNAARSAAWNPVWNAAWNAVGASARNPAWNAAWNAAWNPAWASARASARDAQAAWLRENAKPCFQRGGDA